ncbi:MAG: clostripain-related cysteine peptidase, partial [Anaerolineae bacterium]
RDTEPQFDYVFAGASTDGTNFNGQYWSGDSGGWQYYDVDLGPYVGLDEVWLAWFFHSDESNPEQDYEGVWIDDITLWIYTESEPPATTNLIQNSDFETGDLTAWSATGSTDVFDVNANSGGYSAWLGGIDDASDALYQVFDVPATGVNEARINFWFELDGEETAFEADTFCAGIARDSDEELLIDLGCMDGTESTNGWSEVDYTLSGSELLTVAGETVYIVFSLETDGSLPTSVWVDDVAFIIQTGGTAGDGHEDNDSPSTATALSFDTPITDLTIDPAGDFDYFAFSGSSGQTITIDIDAASNGSSLDSYLWLMDTDGETVLAENDDDGNSFDSYLTHTLPAAGAYYAVVSSYGGDGDRSFFYSISLTAGGSPPPTPPPTPTTPPPSDKKAWTAILYLAGDTNLWREYQPYIAGLERMIGDKSDFLDVVVLLDMAQESPNPRTTRYHIQPNGNYADGVNRWDMGELNMGDPQNLVNFAKWAMQNYPADHYYLGVDDHGNSIAGIAWDDTSNGDNLSPPELYGIMKEITDNGANKIDVLDWEACLMQTFEGAYDMRNFAKYLFGFESVSYGGNTYPRYFENLTASTTPAQFVDAALDAYFSGRSGAVVGSAVDLSQIGAVQTAVDNLADALLSQVGAQKDAITTARTAAQKFDVGDDFRITNEDYYLDLWHMADRLAAQVPAVASEANAVKTAVGNAVLDYKINSSPGEDHSNARGLGIYWPQWVSGAYGDYANHRIFTATRDGRWDDFLAGYFGRRPEQRRGMPVDPEPVQKRSAGSIFLPLVLRSN